ncbi:MAG: nitroreductase family protein [Spirochaetes bacterium]|nr:nitroreductase family protein [Spirochaetota bacterium]
MEFAELCRKRRSVRRFSSTALDERDLSLVLETAMTAPSAGNLQAYRIVLVRDPGALRRLAEAAMGQLFIAQAPVAAVFLALPAVSARRYGERGERLFALQDATIACAYAMLAAEEAGLSTVWVGSFDDAAVASIAGAEAGEVPVAILPVGYAAEHPRLTPRKPLGEMVRGL